MEFRAHLDTLRDIARRRLSGELDEEAALAGIDTAEKAYMQYAFQHRTRDLPEGIWFGEAHIKTTHDEIDLELHRLRRLIWDRSPAADEEELG
ncbi:MAG TPA: hypothetical protein VJN95_18010 [Gemmatimonadales bacterium]|nr:hypothetical protein [Gemmatimonadales bacterium]